MGHNQRTLLLGGLALVLFMIACAAAALAVS